MLMDFGIVSHNCHSAMLFHFHFGEVNHQTFRRLNERNVGKQQKQKKRDGKNVFKKFSIGQLSI